MAGTVVPDDLILEILAKLRPKSLLRFKSVCKTWYSTISDPQFSTKLPWMRPSVLICQNSETFSTITIESLLTVAKSKALTPLSLPWKTEAPSRDIATRLSYSESTRYDRNYLIGSCNGVVCVDHRSNLILWIPSTGKFRRLPRPPSCHRLRTEVYYHYYVWFGYDESIHDYKLVWLDYCELDPVEAELYVFTLKSNAWRRKDDCRLSETSLTKGDDVSNHRIIGVLSDGAVHWRACSDGKTAILALDLATENFQVLEFANYPFDPGRGGCLVGGCSCMYDTGFGGMRLQIMKEYGWQGIVLPRWETRKYYPILFSSAKEILAVFDARCQKHKGETYDNRIMKFRIEEGEEKVSSPETLLDVPNIPNGSRMWEDTCRNNIVLHMEESLVSLTYF